MSTPIDFDFYKNGKIYRIETLGTENSCYFHAILQAYNPTYIENKNVTFRTQMTRTLRSLLAEKLDSCTLTGERVYDILSQGTFRSYSEAVPEYSLNKMIELLNKNDPVDHRFQELLCETLNVDIYILDGTTRDVYYLSNEQIYIKNRPSIVLLYEPGHYSLIGKMEKNTMVTVFDPKSDFIKAIRERLEKKTQ